jgi:hypothetical protein
MYANMASLNAFRRSRGFSEFLSLVSPSDPDQQISLHQPHHVNPELT